MKINNASIPFRLFIHPSFILLFTFFWGKSLSGQYNPFTSYPLKGKVKTIEVVELVGDSANPIERKLETIDFDKEGRPILKQRFESYNRVYTEKSIYEDNKIITFKCYCKDTQALEKDFKPQLDLEPKNKSNYGWASPDDGSERPKIDVHTLDKKGNIIETKQHAKDGSVNFIETKTYDKNNLLTHSQTSFYRNEIDTEQTYQYDANGNCIEHVRHDLDRRKKESTYRKFDKLNRVVNHLHIINRDTTSNHEYRYVRSGNFEEYFSVSKNGELRKLKEFYYNDKNQLLRQISLSSNEPYEEGTMEYFNNGKLAKESYRNLKNNHIRALYYADDKHNNCIKTTQQFTSIEVKPEGEVQQTKQQTFLRKIIYH